MMKADFDLEEPSKIGLEQLVDSQRKARDKRSHLPYKEIPQVEMANEDDEHGLPFPANAEFSDNADNGDLLYFDKRSSAQAGSDKGDNLAGQKSEESKGLPQRHGAPMIDSESDENQSASARSQNQAGQGSSSSSALVIDQEDPKMDEKISAFLRRGGSEEQEATLAKANVELSQNDKTVIIQTDDGPIWKYLTNTVQKYVAQLSKEKIDQVVPTEEQKEADNSSNLFDFEQVGLSQPKFLSEMDVRHPWLAAKKRLDENFVHLSSMKLKPKKEPKDAQVLNIDGKKQSWG